MTTIADLHISILQMTEDQLFSYIRDIRSLRRELQVKPTKKTVKSKKKQLSVENYVDNIKESKREELLEKLIKIREKKRKNKGE